MKLLVGTSNDLTRHILMHETNHELSHPDTLALPHDSEGFRNVPNDAETFRTIPNPSERFGTVPQDSEAFRIVRKSDHTLTVQESARFFAQAGVARSERSIVNWCQPNRQGVARLDAYFDPNDRRYFITQASVDAVIAEEQARAAKANSQTVRNPSKMFGNKDFGNTESPSQTLSAANGPSFLELQKELTDLRITNRAKDYVIDQLRVEREGLTRQLVEASRHVGQLETKLLQLDAGQESAKIDAG